MEVSVYERVASYREWVVEAIDMANDGSIQKAVFSGPDAEMRAREHAHRYPIAPEHPAD